MPDLGVLKRDSWYLAIGSLVLAVASVIWLPAITGPDPNAWLSWSHSLLHGHGIDFRYGPAWKPLPVLVTIPLGLPGKGFAAAAWLLTVRFAFFWCSASLYLLVRKDAGLLAGVVAAVLPFALRPWVNVAVAGESETVALALVLTAALVHFKGKPRATVLLLAAAGLSRPEVWPLLLIYIVWQARSGERKVVPVGIASFVGLGLAWAALPRLLDIGATKFGMTTGHSLHDATFQTIIDNTLGVIPPKAWVLIPIGLVAAAFQRKLVILTLAIAAGLLVVEIATLWALHPPISQTGYTPVLRYFAAAGVMACGVAGYGAQSLRDLFPEGAGRILGGAAAVALVAWSLGTAFEPNHLGVQRAQAIARSTDSAVAAIDSAGGVERVRPCLPFTISSFSAISWDIARRLGLPLSASTTKPHSPSIALDYTAGSWVLSTAPPSTNRGARVIGRSDLWRVMYYPGLGGCLKP